MSNISNIIFHLSAETPSTVEDLAEATEMSIDEITLALVELGSMVTVKDDGIILAPEPTEPVVESPKAPTVRGPTAKVAPRLQVAREALMSLAALGTTAKDVLAAAEGRFVYTDVLLVAREALAAGEIIETKKGRKCSWALPG